MFITAVMSSSNRALLRCGVYLPLTVLLSISCMQCSGAKAEFWGKVLEGTEDVWVGEDQYLVAVRAFFRRLSRSKEFAEICEFDRCHV